MTKPVTKSLVPATSNPAFGSAYLVLTGICGAASVVGMVATVFGVLTAEWLPAAVIWNFAAMALWSRGAVTPNEKGQP